jgi:hypothetical protein
MDGLSKAELDDVVSYAKMLGGVGGVAMPSGLAEVKADSETEMLLDIIVRVAQSRGAEFTGVPALKKSQHYAPFRRKIAEFGLVEYFKHTVAKNNRIRLQAFMWLAVELLYDSLVAMSIPVSSRAMMNHVHRIPSVVNNAFPGYAASGMLHMVIRSKERKHVRAE